MRLLKLSFVVHGSLVMACLLCATGCLSLELGTKPTTITESVESKARMTALEARVSALERMLQESEGTIVTPPSYSTP